MLIVRGVNVFPSAVREVVNEFAPKVSGHILVQTGDARRHAGPAAADPASSWPGRRTWTTTELADAIHTKLREVLTVRTRVWSSSPWGTLSRSEYKSKLVEQPPG